MINPRCRRAGRKAGGGVARGTPGSAGPEPVGPDVGQVRTAGQCHGDFQLVAQQPDGARHARRGTDVLKALALGAQAVLVGRPVLHGLAVAGGQGVGHVLRLLRDELEAAMALTGCATLADIGPDQLRPG